MKSLFSGLFLFLAGLHVIQASHAMCAATTQNLVRLDVVTCQRTTIFASETKPGAHRIHRRGSKITGTLITGIVVESKLVWQGDPREAEYLVETRKLAERATATLFLRSDAAGTCPALLGEEAFFVTDRPCCDTLPADGICLVPAPVTVAKEEKIPERWTVWISSSDRR